jgi:hypothetical protein
MGANFGGGIDRESRRVEAGDAIACEAVVPKRFEYLAPSCTERRYHFEIDHEHRRTGAGARHVHPSDRRRPMPLSRP